MSVGVRQLDDDHKKLISMINELHAGMLAGHSNEVVGGILKRLVAYTVQHFGHEEAFFAQTSFPGAAAHKLEHEKLKQTVMVEVQRFQCGTVGLGIETLNFLRDWLRHHIQESDKAYGPYLNQHGVL
jgi:hemerythrin